MIFEEEVPKSFNLDLSDLSREIWSLLPQTGDFSRKCARGASTPDLRAIDGEAEDVTLFHRERRRTSPPTPRRRSCSSRGRFFNEDDLVEYDVLDYDVDASFFPEREWIDGRTRLRCA